MRVDLITKEFPPNIYGGAGVHVTELSAALAQSTDVRVRCFGEPRTPKHVKAYTHSPDVDETGPAEQALSTNLAMVGDVEGADLVHSHTWYANMAGHWAKLHYGIPHVMTAHSLEPLRPWKAEQLGGGYRLSSWAEQTAVESAERVIAVSRAMRQDILRMYPNVDPHKVVTVHNGIDTSRWRPDSDPDFVRSYGFALDKPLAVFVGRITRQKGLPYLVRALQLLPTDAQVLLCAGAPDTPELLAEVETFIKAAQATHPKIIWEPRHLPEHQLRAVLTQASVFICPSVYEPLGIVNLEAMACATAVVATDTGGIPEVVVNDKTGWLVPIHQRSDGSGIPHDQPKFIRDLAEGITKAYEDPQECARRGEAGLQRAREHFTWEAIATKTLDIYRGALGRERHSNL